MSGSAVLRVKKLSGAAIVRVAAAHNKREIQAELGANGSIDASRCGLNESLAGPATAVEVAALARAMMAGAGVGKLRKDAVRAIEFIVSLAHETRIDERAFFVDAVQWLADRFGGADNILTADIHRDESAPHLHLLVLPLISGRMVGSVAVGGPNELLKLDDFHAEVCAPYGLKRFPPRLTGAAKSAAFAAVMDELKRRGDACLGSTLWFVVRDLIEADPRPFLAELGLEVTVDTKPKKLRSMTAIFTSKGKGSSKPEPETNASRIWFGSPSSEVKPADETNVCSVWFASSTALAEALPEPAPDPAVAAGQAFSTSPTAAPLPARPARATAAAVACEAGAPSGESLDAPPDIVRERDADFAAGTWNADTGEFQPARVVAQSRKASARAWVAQALREATAARCGVSGPGANHRPSNGA